MALEEARRGKTIHTEVTALDTFYLAEDYHQKHSLRARRSLLREYQAIYPDLGDFIDSTAVTRVNGYVAGYGSWEQLQTEIGRLGLSPEGQRELVKMVGPKDALETLDKLTCPVPTLNE